MDTRVRHGRAAVSLFGVLSISLGWLGRGCIRFYAAGSSGQHRRQYRAEALSMDGDPPQPVH